MTELSCQVDEYADNAGLLQKPSVNVKVKVEANGIGITLPGANGNQADVYLERRLGQWVVCVSPTSDEVKLQVQINDDGSMLVP